MTVPKLSSSAQVVSHLWRLCAVLRKDGITYQQYVTELTYLLFLKMAFEKKEEAQIPAQYRWAALKKASETDVLQRYKRALVDLGDSSKISDRTIVAIFQNASTVIRQPANLKKLIDAIEGLHWFSEDRDAFGDAYEGLLQKMAEETKRGAGQYFTPRPLIDVLVKLIKPAPGEIIQDPAAGTGGFIIAADHFMRESSDDYFDLTAKQQSFQLKQAFRGLENVSDTYRLLLMNLFLHKVGATHIDLADTLSPHGASAVFKNADVILTNPPFGPAGGPPTRDDFTVTDRVVNYQLPFVEHIIRALRPGGRAAVIVPDYVLFEEGRAKALRSMLMSRCNLHTILRLPQGIFYAQGVRTNVLFFERDENPESEVEATKEVWIFDMRAGSPVYGKTTPLTSNAFSEFIAAYGSDSSGRAKRTDQGESGRFRRFTRADISRRDDNLDISWLKDDDDAENGGLAPDELASALETQLSDAIKEVKALASALTDRNRLSSSAADRRGQVRPTIPELDDQERGRWPTPTLPHGWRWVTFQDFFEDVTDSNRKLAERDYSASGRFPVIDQGQAAIGGFTDDESLVHRVEPPVIIFGDHTQCVKFIDKTFVQGADGVKVLRPVPGVNPKFAFYALCAVDLPSKGYSRHMKFVRKTLWPKPPPDVQEQIVSLLDVAIVKIDRALSDTSNAVRFLERLKGAVMSKALSGQSFSKSANAQHSSELPVE